jgi:hypothetical protein
VDEPLQAEISRIIEGHRRDTPPSHASGAWREVMDASPLFDTPLEFYVRHRQTATRSVLADRAASTSFIATLPEEERAAVLEQVAALVPSAPGEDPAVELEYITEVFLYTRR